MQAALSARCSVGAAVRLCVRGRRFYVGSLFGERLADVLIRLRHFVRQGGSDPIYC